MRIINRPEKTVVPTIDEMTRDGLLFEYSKVGGIDGIKPLKISITGGIMIKKFATNAVAIIATMRAALRSKI